MRGRERGRRAERPAARGPERRRQRPSARGRGCAAPGPALGAWAAAASELRLGGPGGPRGRVSAREAARAAPRRAAAGHAGLRRRFHPERAGKTRWRPESRGAALFHGGRAVPSPIPKAVPPRGRRPRGPARPPLRFPLKPFSLGAGESPLVAPPGWGCVWLRGGGGGGGGRMPVGATLARGPRRAHPRVGASGQPQPAGVGPGARVRSPWSRPLRRCRRPFWFGSFQYSRGTRVLRSSSSVGKELKICALAETDTELDVEVMGFSFKPSCNIFVFKFF